MNASSCSDSSSWGRIRSVALAVAFGADDAPVGDVVAEIYLRRIGGDRVPITRGEALLSCSRA